MITTAITISVFAILVGLYLLVHLLTPIELAKELQYKAKHKSITIYSKNFNSISQFYLFYKQYEDENDCEMQIKMKHGFFWISSFNQKAAYQYLYEKLIEERTQF